MFMRSHAPLIVLATACALGLSSCAAPPATAAPETVTPIPLTPTSSPTSTSTTVPTLTQTPSLTPTLAVTPGPSSTPAPTPVFGAGTVGDDFLFDNQPPGCELPCWQGLRIGESSAGDVQNMFDTAFGFDGSRDFFADAQKASFASDLLVTWFTWNLNPPGSQPPFPEFFNIAVWVDESTQIVEASSLSGASQRFEQFTAPQRMLRELGVPSNMLVSMEVSAENVYYAVGSLVMAYYDEGITVYYPAILISITRPSKSAPGVAELCLSTLPPSEGHYWVEVEFTRPFTNDLSDLSPIQEYLVGDILTTTTQHLRPFEEVFSLSLEEVAKLAQQQQNPCVYANVP